MPSLLETARSGDLRTLRERLELTVADFDLGGGRLSTSEHLLIEALTYARLGDLSEATHRLRLRAEPKWCSEQDCLAAYKRAMHEKSQGVSA